ncbi:MAG: DUF4238 domain-containing protein [Burkholderiales bacterium]|nr:DUF4238 domain-containing protein [Burkholderiales bacterium]
MTKEQPSADAAQAAPAAKPLLTGPKRHHFLPRFYLEGFAKDGMVAVFDREKNEVRVQQTVNTGVIGHFYTMEDAYGRPRFELEQMLSEFEGKASLTVKRLAAREQLTGEERADLAIFVALAGFRTPDIIESLKLFNSGLISDIAKRMFANVDQVKETMRGKPGSPTSEEELEQEAKEMVDFAQGGQYEVTTNHRWAVGMAMKMAFEVAPLLAGRNWLVVHRPNEKKSFVTTDAPVVLSTVTPREPSFYGIGFGNADAMVVFPLTQSCALVMFGEDGALEHRDIASDAIRHMNSAVADRCQRFVIGREEALVRSLADRLGLAEKEWQPKMQRR